MKVFTNEELASPNDVIVAATGVSTGDLLRGVRYLADSARTQSLVICAATGSDSSTARTSSRGAVEIGCSGRHGRPDRPRGRAASLLGEAAPLVRAKVSDRLNDVTRRFVERSPFLCLATSAATGPVT